MRLSWVAGILAMVGCSSSSPGAAMMGSSSSSGGGPGPSDASVDARVEADADTDGGSTDAGLEDVVLPPCLDDKSTTDAGVDCAANGCATVCANITAHFKLGVAQAATACIAKLASCADIDLVIPCVDTAMSHACGDSTAKTTCTPWVQQCDPGGMSFDQASCEAFVNGMSGGGRQVFGDCVTTAIDTGTCADQIANCASDIRH